LAFLSGTMPQPTRYVPAQISHAKRSEIVTARRNYAISPDFVDLSRQIFVRIMKDKKSKFRGTKKTTFKIQ
jgi:hypothetical protein